jgi:RNA recognition motif-containing protein
VDCTATGPFLVLEREFALTKKIYVGNLSFNATEDQVREMFSEFGDIQSLAMINDRDTGRFRGFAFVEMEDSSANAAIKALNGKEVDGRELNVNEARPREERSGGGGGYGGGNRRSSGGDYNRNRDRNRNTW